MLCFVLAVVVVAQGAALCRRLHPETAKEIRTPAIVDIEAEALRQLNSVRRK